MPQKSFWDFHMLAWNAEIVMQPFQKLDVTIIIRSFGDAT